MYLARVGAALVDDARHLVAINISRVGEQMCSVFIRLCLKTAANVIGAVRVKIITVSCVQTCVSEFVADRHLLACIAEIFIQNDVFAPQDMNEKTTHIIWEWEMHNRYAEIARELKRVARAVFVDEILDADFDVEHDTSVLLPLVLPFRIPKNELKSITQLLLIFFTEVVCVTIKHDFCFVEEFREVVHVTFGVGGGIALRECGQIVGGGGLLQ